MPLTPINTYNQMGGVSVAYPAQFPVEPTVAVRLAPSTTYPQGCLLGELTASPGVFAPYVAANVDGTQNAKLILKRACITDASGNITFGTAATGMDYGQTSLTAAAFFAGQFRTVDLPQAGAGSLDAIAATKTDARHIGFLLFGTLANGVLFIGN